jgi:hypothetical protein
LIIVPVADIVPVPDITPVPNIVPDTAPDSESAPLSTLKVAPKLSRLRKVVKFTQIKIFYFPLRAPDIASPLCEYQ